MLNVVQTYTAMVEINTRTHYRQQTRTRIHTHQLIHIRIRCHQRTRTQILTLFQGQDLGHVQTYVQSLALIQQECLFKATEARVVIWREECVNKKLEEDSTVARNRRAFERRPFFYFRLM